MMIPSTICSWIGAAGISPGIYAGVASRLHTFSSTQPRSRGFPRAAIVFDVHRKVQLATPPGRI